MRKRLRVQPGLPQIVRSGHAADRDSGARMCPQMRHSARTPGSGRSQCREAVGEFPRSDDFLYINDKKSILRWILSVSGAPLRPPAALL